jgi:hypothetical protein
MSPEKPSKNEDEYFAKRDAELLETTRAQQANLREQIERQKHIGKCPRCGLDLQLIKQLGVEVDICPEGHGTWLDAGELEQIVTHQEPGLLRQAFTDVMSAIKGKKGPKK